MEFVEGDVLFPPNIVELSLEITDGTLNVAQLQCLTRLTALSLTADTDPLDLSSLTTVECLNAPRAPVAAFPTSLRRCSAAVKHADFSSLSRLSHLTLHCDKNARVTLPIQLAALEVLGTFPKSNINTVSLVSLYCRTAKPLTSSQKAELPTTLETSVLDHP